MEPTALGRKWEDLFFLLFRKGFPGKYSTFHFHEKSWWEAHMGRIFFIAQKQKVSFDLFLNNFCRLFYTSFRDPNPILDERNLYVVSNSTRKSQLLSRLTERNHGLSPWRYFSCFALSGRPYNAEIWRCERQRSYPLNWRWRLTFWAADSLSARQLLGISAQTGHSLSFHYSSPLTGSISHPNLSLEG